METKRLIIGMMLALAVMVGWQYGVFLLDKKYGWSKQNAPTTQQATTTQPIATATTGPTTAPTTGGPEIAAATSLPALRAESPSSGAVLSRIGSEKPNDETYAMALALVTRGAGVDSVTLNQFKHVSEGAERYVYQQPYEDAIDVSRPLATRTVTVNGSVIDLKDADWVAESINDSSASYKLDIVGPAGPVVRLRKVYNLSNRKEAASTDQGFEVGVRLMFENLSDQPVTVRTAFNGPTTPPKETERSGERFVLGGYVDDGQIFVRHVAIEEFTKDYPTHDMTKTDGKPFAWVGADSTYFNAIIRPIPLPKDATTQPVVFDNVTATALHPEREPDPKTGDLHRQIVTVFQTAEIKLAARESAELPLRVLFGPKERDLLNAPYYSAFPLAYNKSLVITSGPCGWCTFQPVIDVLVWMLGVFHWMFRDWGLAIIALVIVVRSLLHPITKKSQVSMMKMGKMGPEMERLKKKYGDDKDALNKAMMQFYKEQGATPVLGCLPMFLQMPIWIALWTSLQSTFELRQAPFLWGFTWIHDLAKPDYLIHFKNYVPIPVLGWIWPNTWVIHGINILPLLLAVVFYLQQKYTPKPPAQTPEQEQQQKMMQWMSLLFPIFLYSGPSGLNLYILTSTTIGIIESKVIRDHIKQREEAEKAGKVIIDAPKKMKRRGDDEIGGSGVIHGGPRGPKPKPKGLMGWVASLQAKAEEMRNEQDRRKK